MPKISELPTDAAIAVADLIPFVDVTASRTEVTTAANLAASAAFSGQYAPLATDSIWVPAAAFSIYLGSPTLGAVGTYAPAWLLDASSSEWLTATVSPPSWWTTFAVDIYWANAGAGSGVVRLNFWDGTTVAEGDAVTAAANVVITDQTARAQGLLDIFTPGTRTSGALVGLMIQRDASDVNDTLANDAAFIGMKLRRAS